MRALSEMIGQDLQSGLWFKDEGSFINAREARQADLLQDVRIFDFDRDYRLKTITRAERAEYRQKGVWQLYDVVRTQFTPAPRTEREPQLEWHSAVSPDLLDALIMKPERMSAWALHKYTEHLAGNRQKTERYDIALWKKLFYPLAALVMMALALPFAYMQARAGAVGLKVFLGAHRALAELAAVCRGGAAQRPVPRYGSGDDVVGGTTMSRVPASRSWRNCRSASSSAQRIEIGSSSAARTRRASALRGVTSTSRMRQAFMASVCPPRSQQKR
jgi:hypothetical protein